MLSLRDREVRALAEAAMWTRGAPDLAAAIELALRNEIERVEGAMPLRDRVALIRVRALAGGRQAAAASLDRRGARRPLGRLMFVETSAVVAIRADEPEAAPFADATERAVRHVTGAHVRLEATTDLARILGLNVRDAQGMFDAFIAAAGITVMPVDDAVARRAVEAFAVYGKGRGHPARLNFGDCLSYACAACSGLPILFRGRDFARTHLASAVA